MKQISVIFSKRKGFNLFSELIKWALKTPFSHCAIKIQDGDTGQQVYYQASSLFINTVSEQEFLAKEDILDQYDFQVSDEVFKNGKTFGINQLGKPYDFKSVLGFAKQILVLKFKNETINNPVKLDGSEYVCSQFTAAYIDAADNVDIGDLSNMTPLALYNVIPTLPKVWN